MLKLTYKILGFILVSFIFFVFGVDTYKVDDYAPINNTDSDTVVNEQNLWDDSLRQGIRDVWKNIEWIAYEDINNSEQAQNATLKYFKKIFDYFIALLGFFTLLYLLYNFFIMLTASWDDNKFKKWVDWIKTAGLVIIWLGVSWIFISFIFYLVDKFTG